MDLAPIAVDHDCPEFCSACGARGISICHVLPHPDLRRLSDCASVKSYDAGDLIVPEGAPAEFVYNITDGMVMLFKLLVDGRRQVLGYLFKGDFIGLSIGVDYTFGIQALTQVKLCRFNKAAFNRLLLETPSLETELLLRASDELRAAQTHLTLLGRKRAMERVCSFLLHIADRNARLGGAPEVLFLPMTRSDIADYLGLTTETVSRIISGLKRRQIIQLLQHGAVRLLDRTRLETAAEAA